MKHDKAIESELERLKLIIRHLYDAKSEQTDDVLLSVANQCIDGLKKDIRDRVKEEIKIVEVEKRVEVEKIVEVIKYIDRIIFRYKEGKNGEERFASEAKIQSAVSIGRLRRIKARAMKLSKKKREEIAKIATNIPWRK